jgi:hypothetical protein
MDIWVVGEDRNTIGATSWDKRYIFLTHGQDIHYRAKILLRRFVEAQLGYWCIKNSRGRIS